MTFVQLSVDQRIALVQPEYVMAEQLFKVKERNKQYLARYLDFIHDDMTVEEDVAFIKDMLTQQVEGTGRLFIIYYDDVLVGTIDLHGINQKFKKGEIGYWIDEAYAGRGIVPKCVKRLCDFGFTSLDLNKIVIYCDVDNHSSIRVAIKSGFKFINTDREEHILRGELRDMHRYELLKREWQASLQ
ncbi:GNAT family N-acetyltransferase [Staphylococcus auricularis]|uniref:GNAT family N-acetyltransferase n=1 Tax=Staphylococcus auricularis TaxID=29379 RepID=A0ABX5IFI3_9STAP|nr:GNAT family protein [Staphylococcus auricularis]MCE5038829.1 GNAT family N-acetyltransferase [Staphylococcus auricularis]MEB6570631.1 GNAT family N-acetyltransferase [Staphylococcus auricularis]PTH18886.1 GNAT family N-acetyltransferase [Staphylococcus auricularis]PTH27082.1 GNAT family N-acetyltransferase [Staphylococcus auricularis]